MSRWSSERLSQEWGLQSYQVSLAWLLSRPAGRLGDRGRGNCRGSSSPTPPRADVTLDQAQLDALTALPAGKDS